jgi:hypothetical protein
MRKLLLASAAALGGTMTMASVVSAQVQTQYPYTPPAGTTVLSAPNTGTAIQTWTSNPPVSPGSYTVRLAGRLTAYFQAGSDSVRGGGQVTTAAGAAPTSLNTKQAPYTVYEYARLYPSFDAQAANGLKYGAFLEIRQDNNKPPGGGVNGSISGSNASRGSLYFRRETAYIGTDQAGFLRYGATDGPSSLFITGTMENFDDGGWNGDYSINTANTQPTWPFADQGAMYSTSKIVYVSPKFFNLVDFGVAFEPNTGTVGYSQCNGTTAAPSAANGYSGTGCDAASSTSVTGENARRRNTIDAALRVRTAVGPVGLAGTVGYIGSTNVANNATPPAALQYQGLSVLDVGAQMTVGGLAVGGHFTGGKINGAWQLSPQGADNSIAWIGGASYAVGPVIVGASYFNYMSPGAKTNLTPAVVGNRTEYGVAAGGTLTLAPGAYVFLSYIYGARHQSGVDFISGTVSDANSGAGFVKTNNNVQSQAIEIGTQFRW